MTTTSSQRRTMLLKALDYAHEAVNLDATRDGRGAVVAYRKCTALLDEVIVAAAPLDEKSTTKQSLSDVRHWHDRYAKRAERLMQKYKISPLSVEVISSA